MSGRRAPDGRRRRGRRQILLHRRFAFRRVGSELSRGVRWVVVTSTHGKRRITFLILLGIEIVRLCNDAHYKNITNAVVVLGRPSSSSQSSTRATPVRVVALPRVASSFKPIARAHRAHRDALARRPRAARRPRRFDSHRGNESETNECRAPSPRRFATSTAPPRVDRCVSSVARCPTREVHPSSFSITDLFF